jgi:hypothetical protein
MITTPVVLIIFKRPDLTARVLAAIAQVRPRRLLVVADGPRVGRPDDVEACAAARAVIDRVDWDCEVLRNYSDVNLGCGRRPATGISWALERFDEAIILEDDCVPHPTFFPFCEELLARYRNDERVMHIAGSTYRQQPIPTAYSYVFSQFNSAWGWATWRRAWRHFDASVKLWPRLRNTSWLKDLFEDERAVRYWYRNFETAHAREGNVSYWDHQWGFACWARNGLSVAPKVNLVSNIGCGPDGTHTLYTDDPIGNVPAHAMTFPLVHPPSVIQSREWDRNFLREIILPRLEPPTPSRLRVAASRIAPAFVKRSYRQLAAAVRASVTSRS